MVARALFGKKGASYGGWISKPGLDVLSASPGDFLLDTNSQIFQTVLKGTTQVATEGAASIPAGTVVTVSPGLPAGFGGFSNIIVQCTYYIIDNSGNQYSESTISTTYLRWSTGGGVLNLSVVWRSTGGTGTGSLTLNHWAAWTVYRAQF